MSDFGQKFDPVTASASALAHGRIGLVAWAIFERGDGLVLSFEKQGEYFTIEVDSASEWRAYHDFLNGLGQAGKLL